MTRSYANGVSSTPLLGQTISENLRATVARFPDNEAIVAREQGKRLTYREFDAEIDRLSRALLACGLGRGDRVGMWSPNTLEWALIQYATARVGIILVNINPSYRTEEVVFALNQSGCRAIVTVDHFHTSNYREMLESVRDRLPMLETIVHADTDEWGQLLARGDSVSIDRVHEIELLLDPDDPINIQYTSGTTGNPKGATLSHTNILNNGYFVGEGCHYSEHDRVCIPVPYYHCFGMVMGNLACTSHGATIVLPSPGFDPTATLETIQEERCTSLYGVPTMFIAELALPNFSSFDLSSLRTGIMAGSPCPVEVMKRVNTEMHLEEVTICYGMTETSPVSTQTAVDDPIDKRVASVGRVMPHLEVTIVDANDHVVPRGEPGELLTRGYSVMLGYWEDPEKTASVIDPARWMHTGDLAQMDDEGYVYVVGRIKDVIIRGGENVYPREVEEFLYQHPAIEDISVIGVPDAKYGEEVAAWVRLKPDMSVTDEELRAFCTGKIAHYKIPRYFKFVDAFPMTVTGKVQKYLMREALTAELNN
ncbi:MAG: AMP-binding protein [Ferrimicrobium sp.]